MGSISEIFARALSSASKAYNLPTIEPSTQELFGSALLDLTALTDHISELSLFSPNETLEDISTTHLVYLLAPYATAEVRARISLKALDDPGARVPFVEQTQRYLRAYVDSLDQYGIVSSEEKELFGKDMGKVPAAQRREIKIQQYRKEKELRTRIEVCGDHRVDYALCGH
ncbi:TAP42-like protein [Pterulicium gracile]|uniref:TAP42-like protein n=1 Tax=Pterulicium gracile TaxID=1884261 RepID=A0A5C3QI04_9AGAR|nr:TAP42-like protein [Pterula gracilis]